MKKQVCRYEINRFVQGVLVRHSADLKELNYSCSGKTVYLYGNLKKEPKREFSPSNVEALFKELSNLPHVNYVQFALDNWKINQEFGSLKISKK
jgi:hypothetical protein